MAADICFLSLDNLNRVPYLNRYEKLLNLPYDVIYWNRSGLHEQTDAVQAYEYGRVLSNNDLGWSGEKLSGYLGFRKFASNILMKRRYRLVIALTTNVGVLLGGVLRRRYNGRYIIDVRDYWHDFNTFYRKAETKLMSSSALVVVSSPAYGRFVPVQDYVTMHNMQLIDKADLDLFACDERPDNSKISVVCVGAAKNRANDEKVIRHFAQSESFHLSFIGKGYDELQSFVDGIGAENVHLEGYFQPSETLGKYRNADMILSMYGSHTPYYDYALSNKLYFAAQLGLPIIVSADTYIAEVVEEYGLGFAFDVGVSDEMSRLQDYFQNIDKAAFTENCKRFLEWCDADEAVMRASLENVRHNLLG